MPALDGAASVLIGLLLGFIGAILARESKGLLMGEPADRETMAAVLALARRTSGVVNAREIFTVQLAPEQVVAGLCIDFEDALTAGDVETTVAELERRIRSAYPQFTTVLIKPQSLPGD